MFFGRASRPLFAADVEHVLSRARGVVLDLGTGSGDWTYMFTTARNQNITRVLFLEPNTHFHPKLRKMAQAVGLNGRYEIIGGGVEELDNQGVKKGTVDTVVTVHVLCSVSAPEPVVKGLYEYLRPGGQWLVYEHVKVREGGSVASTFQGERFCSRTKNDVLIGHSWPSFTDTINFFWPICFDGCSLTRDTKNLLLRVGKWEVADLAPGSNEGQFNMLPHIRGALTKAK